MGAVEGQPLLTSNQWQQVERGGEGAIKRWIDTQMAGKSCLVVLIGNQTAGRRWVKYEIKKAWDDGKGVVGVYIHGLKNLLQVQDTKGRNPFDDFTLGTGTNQRRLSAIVKAYDPPYTISTSVYNHIKTNLASWVEEAIQIRTRY
jgi:hypothetical protein